MPGSAPSREDQAIPRAKTSESLHPRSRATTPYSTSRVGLLAQHQRAQKQAVATVKEHERDDDLCGSCPSHRPSAHPPATAPQQSYNGTTAINAHVGYSHPVAEPKWLDPQCLINAEPLSRDERRRSEQHDDRSSPEALEPGLVFERTERCTGGASTPRDPQPASCVCTVLVME